MNRDDAKSNRSVFPDGSSVKTAAVAGVVKVHESVVASIIRKATCSVPGVIRLAGNMLVDNIAEFVGSNKVLDRSINIEMGENAVNVEVRIIVAYGVFVPDVARAVQTTVTAEIFKITGMQVPRIDVVIADLEDPPEEDVAVIDE